jgi:hypothetical protein
MIIFAMGLAFLLLAFLQPRESKNRKPCMFIGWGASFAGLVQLAAQLMFTP